MLLRRHKRSLSLLWEDESESLAIVDESGWWPVPEVLVYAEGRRYHLAHRRDTPRGAHVVARVRQRLDGLVIFTATNSLTCLPKGQSVALEPGNESIQLDERTTLSLESPAASPS